MSLLVAPASAAPKCGVFGTACLHVKDSGGNVRLETFEGAVDGSKGTWDHAYSIDGKMVLMAHAQKARVSKCTTPKDVACASTTLELNGICDLKVGPEPAIKGNFVATLVDHAACDSLPDTYSIVIRSGPWIGKGDVVHEVSGPIECGGLRISTPK